MPMPLNRPLWMRPAALIAIHAMAACARSAPPPAPAPPETARLAPVTARYHLVEHRHVEQQYHGQTIVTDAATRATLAIGLDSAPPGFALEVIVDSIAVSGDAGVTAEAVAAAAGARYRADVSPDGSVEAVTGPGAAEPLMDQLALRMHELVPRMPAGGALPGATWSDTTHLRGRTAGIPITIETRARHRSEETWTELDGRRVLPITSVTEYVLSGEGERAGQWLIMAGTGVSHLRRLLTHDAAVALGIRHDTLHVTIELPGTGGRIPLIQIRTDTLRRVD